MNNAISMKNITKKYNKKMVLDDISITFEKGKIYGLLGPNGSGKTTLMKLIAGLHRPNSGELNIGGMGVSYQTKAKVAYLATENFLPGKFTLNQCIDFFEDMYPGFSKEKCCGLMNQFSIDPTAKVSKLSSGMVAKAKLALILSRDAEIYIFDEPLNGIDYIAKNTVIESIVNIHNENKTFIITSHMVSEIENVFDHVILIKDAKIIVDADADDLRNDRGMSIADIYVEEFKQC